MRVGVTPGKIDTMTDSGAAAPHPPTGGRLASAGLIRPLHDRKLAGVCAGLGRITGTDPLLWRVVVGTLVVLYGSGLVLYLAGWLLMPSEGDEASALGALFSRRRSATPKAAALLMLVAAVSLLAVSMVGTSGRPFMVFGVLVLALVWLSRHQRPTPAGPFAGDTTGHRPPGRSTATLPVAAAALSGPVPRASETPSLSQRPVPAETATRPKSALGLVLGSITVILVSLAAIARMQGAAISMGDVFATGMLLCGAGLLVATWWGRARGLILISLVMLIGMGTVSAVNAFGRGEALFSDQHYRPHAVEEIPDSLQTSFGRARLDLSTVKFADDDTVRLDAGVLSGTIEIEVPANLDVEFDVDVRGGSATCDGQPVHPRERPVFEGADGAGGGRLEITGTVNAGVLEVQR